MIESPTGGMPGKAPRWDLTGTEGCGGGKVFSWTLLVFLEYIGGRSRSVDARGAHEGGGTPGTLVAASLVS